MVTPLLLFTHTPIAIHSNTYTYIHTYIHSSIGKISFGRPWTLTPLLHFSTNQPSRELRITGPCFTSHYSLTLWRINTKSRDGDFRNFNTTLTTKIHIYNVEKLSAEETFSVSIFFKWPQTFATFEFKRNLFIFNS